MARTIGTKYKNRIKLLVKQANGAGIINNFEVEDFVNKNLPDDAYNTWEGAWAEINRFVWDINMKEAI